jgi:DNA-binding NarL/FixJ family response regulator
MRLGRFKKSESIRILIADDHALFKQILGLTLEGAGMEIIATVSDGRRAVEATLEQKPDCVLLDIAMPEMDGLAALSIIKYLSPDTPVIILTGLADPLYMARAGELGAEAFFSKNAATEELIAAIQSLASGKRRALSGESARKFKASSNLDTHPSIERSAPPSTQNLTNQESLILTLVAMGLPNPAIMEKLHISNNTVKTHIHNIFTKLEVSDRTQAAIWALQNGYGVLSEPLTSIHPEV